MKIVVIGTRGIPNIQGGVETHCQELYPRLAKLGCEITLITRTPYIDKKNRKSDYKNIKLKHIYAPKIKSLEAIIHTFVAVMYARIVKCDLVHIHTIGPALMVPLARMLGMKTVLTHHGPDYDRAKWGVFAKLVIRLGEYLGVRYSNEIIVISNIIGNIIKDKYGRDDAKLIHNGVLINQLDTSTDYLKELGIKRKEYIIAVGRFVEEKGFHDLIEAWNSLESGVFKLVIVGDADHETNYSRKIKELACESNIILTGFIKGKKLSQIYSHAYLFVMPSYHEGLPIALLEAMSYNLKVLVSDIPANLEVPLNRSNYFKVGKTEELADKIMAKLKQFEKPNYTQLLKSKYDWDVVAKETCAVYKKMV
jgi:glycosyltransferase involved in cell wall biosynthesis